MSVSKERRRLQRVRFNQPLTGSTNQGVFSVLDMSLGGIQVEHTFPFAAGRPVRLDLEWNGHLVPLQCHVVRCRLIRSSHNGTATYASGLRFSNMSSESGLGPRDMVLQLVTRALRERPARILRTAQ